MPEIPIELEAAQGPGVIVLVRRLRSVHLYWCGAKIASRQGVHVPYRTVIDYVMDLTCVRSRLAV